jgi:hypothetical protein
MCEIKEVWESAASAALSAKHIDETVQVEPTRLQGIEVGCQHDVPHTQLVG